MTEIKKLPADLIPKIAAGEVITRPVSVVKELVENSLDANSTSIHIELADGGIQEIVVVDNGEGIPSSLVALAFENHTTNKVTGKSELAAAQTLGFRGEALASIAAASTVTMQTRAKSEGVGTMISVQGGEVKKISEIGMDVGTTVRAANLFANIPARRKFLKKPATEYRKVLDLVTSYALSFPSVGIELISEGKQVLNLPKNQELDERIQDLFGEDFFRLLAPIENSGPQAKVSGYVGTSAAATSAARRQFAFVNGRPVNQTKTAKAVKEGFGTHLAENLHPPFIVFISPRAGTFNVNVHPQKSSVQFSNEKSLYQTVSNAVKKAVESAKNVDKSGKNESVKVGSLQHGPPADLGFAKVADREEVIQIQNLYLAFQSEKGIVVIDQHAAHERILYEDFLEAFEGRGSTEKTTLLTPLVLELSADEHVHLVSYLRELIELGFEIEDFGGGSFRVRSVPKIFENRDIEKLLGEVLEDLESANGNIDQKPNRVLSYMACRSAIKQGDILSLEERRSLVNKLAETNTDHVCAHGRPVQVELTLPELAKMFKHNEQM